ncbi:MAG: TonB-dependent receptor [Alphaproteobacteria bacterium]|nr:TonB-dependent receptor [Alphaproteobacteria bacterium]
MRNQRTVVLCLLATTSITSAAIAQPTTPAPAATDNGKIEKVVVTAQRRSQKAQSVGIALTPITGTTLRERGISVINGLENVTPSLEVENQFGSGQPSFTIRGIGFRDYATNNTPTVGVYVDEVAYTLPTMTQGVLFDVERVEVLRGPQGTLYGRNTTGGAINFISRKPTSETSAGFNAEFGRFNAMRAEGYVNGGIAKGVDARLSIATQQGGAWQVNRETGEELGDADKLAARALVDLTLSDNVDVLLNVHGYRDQSDGLGLQLFRNFAPFAAHTGRTTSWGTSPAFAALAGTTANGKPFRDNEGWGASATVNANLDFAQLTYIASIEHLDRREYNDYDAAPTNIAAVYFKSDIEVMSHELRLASKDEGPFSWIVGAYYATEDLGESYNSSFLVSFGPNFDVVRTPYSQEVSTLAFFGQSEYRFNPMWNIVAGLRWEQEDRDLINLGTFANGFGSFNFANGTGTDPITDPLVLENRSTSLNEVTGKASLEFTPNEDVLLYASVSRGIKSGGFTAYNTLNPNAINPFNPEELWAYEIGVKSDLADDTLRLNAAAYYYDYTDQQVQSAIFDAGTGAVVGRIVNAPSSEVYGGELEVIWKASPELTISQSLGWKHGEFKEFQDLNTAAPPATINRAGQDIGFPELSYAGAIEYERQTTLGFVYRAIVDYNYRDEQSFPLLGTAYTIDSYWLMNASIGIRPDGSPWEFALWGRNVLDEEYDEQRNFFALPDVTPVAAPGAPATYGIRVSADF